ncbi:DUF4194 domain-containing protein [Nocardiopsis chromatogenes]|uniref:DUF4194 domain-containing protein n=1 Tax=Nocardiopsis chromatogenes TaxID=280239 RepID=UPI00034C9F6D|nr:DUF4194 domain-containing protein [Nocardiopsis chromatogenes]
MPDNETLRLSQAVVPLLKGVVYRDQQEQTWQVLLERRAALADYVRVMGLGLEVDETEGYAFLRTLPESEFPEDLGPPPRLVPRRSLSFPVSLLLALLRRRLAEADADGSEPRLILTRAQIVDMIRHFLPETSNEARLFDRIDAHIDKVVQLGFLRQVKEHGQTWEVRRVLKAFVDAETLSDFEARLEEYAQVLTGGKES